MNTPRDDMARDDMARDDGRGPDRSDHDDSQLSPEERALAQRLSQLDARAAPSAALDARILAAARGMALPAGQAEPAVANPGQPASQAARAAKAAPVAARQTQRRKPRWQLPVGIAASLALAVGIAWQLRPQPETHLEYHAPAVGPATTSDQADQEQVVSGPVLAEQAAADAVAPQSAAVASPDDTPASALPRESAPSPLRQVAPEPTKPVPSATAIGEVMSAPAPAIAPPPPPPPAPPAPPAAVSELRYAPAPAEAKAAAQAEAMQAEAERSESMQLQRNEQMRAARNQAVQPASAPAAPAAAPVLDSISVTGSRVRSKAVVDAHHDQPMDDQPPATVDSPEVRKAWLHRVRELRDDGQLDEARASLREFHRRYPDAPLPDDLRPLLDE